jgi:large subunit ribosomal protein L4
MDDIFKLPIFNIKGEKLNKFADFSMFSDVKVNEHVIYLAIKNYLANQRQGTHKTKERSEVKGSTRKLFRQKGTGGARRGDIKSPLLRGGGRIFGPKPRDYSFKMNKNEKRLALLSAIRNKLDNNIINVVDEFNLENFKTKLFVDVMDNLKMSTKKNLIIVDSKNENLYLSSRNIQNVEVVDFSLLNTYDVIGADKIYFEEKAISSFCNRVELN